MTRRTFGDRELSPNQEYRRDEIVEAVCRLLHTGGVAACTVRAVAHEAGISKSAVNYYFKDSFGLIDLGFSRLARRFHDHIRDQACRLDDPTHALWRTVMGYLTPWGPCRGMGLLWAEYYLDGVRVKRLDGVIAAHQDTVRLFAEALAKVSTTAEAHAHALTRHVTGAILSEPHLAIDARRLLADLSRLIDLPAPTSPEFSCDTADCPYHGGPWRTKGHRANMPPRTSQIILRA